MSSADQADASEVQSEILREARRTTHAVRAIARFVLLIVTYQVIAGVPLESRNVPGPLRFKFF